jgi:hypothetical protein
MPVFSANSAATFESGTVGAEGLVAIVEGSLTFLVSTNVILTPQGSVGGFKIIHESRARKPQKHEKCRFLGLFRPFEAAIHRLERV